MQCYFKLKRHNNSFSKQVADKTLLDCCIKYNGYLYLQYNWYFEILVFLSFCLNINRVIENDTCDKVKWSLAMFMQEG